ncbi:hypothetical protein C9374_001040 [Naegleria lovaniensis]|uniref:Ras-GAP domain-containing protein n=1 Tax=Naegleria lovaniensis TaxID=51637 RepID=A0AA88GSQ9_NAELO|nr:uncharacterized protein C9374_001040 [Naegleria lovaniensis]KAG2388190.1 hypothetical protein C9374_001040 [Naegleria lovaniensis]
MSETSKKPSSSTSPSTATATTNPPSKPAKGIQKLAGDIGKKYKLLVQIMTSDPRYAKALADVVPPAQHEKLADSLISLSYEIGASLAIIKSLIGLEFDRKQQHPNTILRVNSIVSKMMGKYTKRVGTEYLRLLLGKVVNEVVEQAETLDLEVDPEKISGDNKQEIIDKRLQQIEEVCQRFVDRITSDAMIEEMPRELRAVCYFLKQNGEFYKFDIEKMILPLVSGFVCLRYICPTIAMPQNADIIKMDDWKKGNVRPNLTQIARVIQKLANGELFDTATPALMPLNGWIQKNQNNMLRYLGQLPIDPKQQEGLNPFGDLQRSITFEDIHYKSFDMEDLLFLHTLIYDYGYELIVSLQNEVIMTHDKRPVSIVSTETDFLSLVQDLGPPPERERKIPPPTKPTDDRRGSVKKPNTNTATDTPPATPNKLQRETLVGATYDQIQDKVLERSMDNLMKNAEKFDLSEMDRTRFLYVGKPTRTNLPVVYLILHRLKQEFLNHNDKLMVYIYKTLGPLFNSKYCLIIDLSWAELTDEYQALLYRAVVAFARLMKIEHLSNCQQVYVLHPNFKTKNAVDDIFNIIPNETRQRLIKTKYDWTSLSDIIEPIKIWIPFVSKKFIPTTYNLMQMKGEKGEGGNDRLLKITNESLLVLDSKLGTVLDEIPFSSIIDIRTKKQTNEFIIRHRSETEQQLKERGGDLGYISKTITTPTSQEVQKRFNCVSDQQRDNLVETIADVGVRFTSLEKQQTFVVEKDTKSGKRQKRILKFAYDSVLVFKDGVIKREIPFSTLQSFYIDKDNKTRLFINFMLLGRKKAYVVYHDNAISLRDSLLDTVLRFKFNVDLEKELFIRKDLDIVVDRFFSAAKDKSLGDDENLTSSDIKQSINMNHASEDIKKLFHKFHPQSHDKRAALNVEKMKIISNGLNLDFNTEQCEHMLEVLDEKKMGYVVLDDLVRNWIFNKRMKGMIQKRKEAQQKRSELLQKQGSSNSVKN